MSALHVKNCNMPVWTNSNVDRQVYLEIVVAIQAAVQYNKIYLCEWLSCILFNYTYMFVVRIQNT